MTKAELISEMSARTGYDKAMCGDAIEAFMKITRNTLIDGKNIYLRGFGTFHTVQRAEKVGQNISKGKAIIIPKRMVPVFKPTKDFIRKTAKAAQGREDMNF